MEDAWDGIKPFNQTNPIQTMDHLATVLGDTLELLAEVSEYLNRLPLVPATRELINKIEAHQNDPGALTAMRIAKQIEVEAQSRVVGIYTHVGLPVIEVEVHHDTVRLKIGPEPVRRSALARLERGQELELSLRDKRQASPLDACAQ